MNHTFVNLRHRTFNSFFAFDSVLCVRSRAPSRGDLFQTVDVFGCLLFAVRTPGDDEEHHLGNQQTCNASLDVIVPPGILQSIRWGLDSTDENRIIQQLPVVAARNAPVIVCSYMYLKAFAIAASAVITKYGGHLPADHAQQYWDLFQCRNLVSEEVHVH